MLSPSSIRRTRIRSCSGVNDVVAIALHLLGAIWRTEARSRLLYAVTAGGRSQQDTAEKEWNWLF
jgi:hypothetical protein